MLLAAVVALLSTLVRPASGQTDPALRILRFTADWCPTCRVLDPRIEAAVIEAGPGTILVSDFDLSDKQQALSHRARAASWRVEDIWSRYQGRTGFAVVANAETGAPLTCLGLPMSSRDMADTLRLAQKLTAGTDLPESPFLDNCPKPGLGQLQPQP